MYYLKFCILFLFLPFTLISNPKETSSSTAEVQEINISLRFENGCTMQLQGTATITNFNESFVEITDFNGTVTFGGGGTCLNGSYLLSTGGDTSIRVIFSNNQVGQIRLRFDGENEEINDALNSVSSTISAEFNSQLSD